MSSAMHQLPLPVGARFAAPSRRANVDIWAAPKPVDMVLDPWAPPVGQAIAATAISPWKAPVASERIGWMAAPPALLPAPDPVLAAGRSAAATSAERALVALRSLADSPTGAFPSAPAPLGDTPEAESLSLEEPVWMTMPAVGTIDPVPGLPAPTADDAAAAPRADIARWRLAAMVTGIGAAAVAVVTLLSSIF